MSTPSFSYKERDGKASIVFTAQVTSFVTRVVPDSNPRFNDIRDYLLERHETPDQIDVDYVLQMIDAGPEAATRLIALTDQVSVRGNTIYFDGDPLDNSLTRHLVRMIEQGEDVTGLALFLNKLASNPSKASQQALYDWIGDRNLTITDEGNFIAYKGVTENFLSVSQGHAFVDGEEVNGRVPNRYGTVVSIPRSEVDPNSANHCSVGLHVGSYSYARGFAPQLLRVEVNPRDVVSVPPDESAQKMRVCRYLVLPEDEQAPTEEEKAVVGRHRVPDHWTEDEDDYEADVEDDIQAEYDWTDEEADDFDEDEADYCDNCGEDFVGGECVNADCEDSAHYQPEEETEEDDSWVPSEEERAVIHDALQSELSKEEPTPTAWERLRKTVLGY